MKQGSFARRALIALIAVLFFSSAAFAAPILQLFTEGAFYERETESWLLKGWNFGNGPVKVWAIGNVSGPGGKGTIFDVHLSILYDSVYHPTFSLTPSKASAGYAAIIDNSLPRLPAYIQTGAVGSRPKLSDGSSLPSPDIYGRSAVWQEFYLGNFDQKDSPIGDFVNTFPSFLYSRTGEINAYELNVTSGLVGDLTLYMDLYGSIKSESKKKITYKSVFEPFSHDTTVTAFVPPPAPLAPVPEPSSALLLGIGLISLAGAFHLRGRITLRASERPMPHRPGRGE